MTEFESLQAFANELGWQDLQRFERQTEHGLIIWHESGNQNDPYGLMLQINVTPYSLAMISIRYRIVSGWHRFEMSNNIKRLKKEAVRLSPYVAAECFRDLPSRRAYRLRFPECANYSWKQIQEKGYPYELD